MLPFRDYAAIDVHAHLMKEDPLGDKCLREMDRLHVEQTWLMAVDNRHYPELEGNDAVRETVAAHPDRYIGFAYVNLDSQGPREVDRVRDQGFRGLKLLNPRHPYDHEKYFPVYEKAARAGLIILFHTGIVSYSPRDAEWRVSSAHMRPIFLDPIARAFPTLRIIGAHLGTPWIYEARDVARMLPNVYFDLSGGPKGWAKIVDAQDWRKIFGWEKMFDKMLFASDGCYQYLEATLALCHEILDQAQAGPEQRKKVFRDNALHIRSQTPES